MVLTFVHLDLYHWYTSLKQRGKKCVKCKKSILKGILLKLKMVSDVGGKWFSRKRIVKYNMGGGLKMVLGKEKKN